LSFFGIVARSKILLGVAVLKLFADVADLRGKRVGVTRFGASTDFAIRTLLEKHGLKPITDVPIMQLGGMPEIAAALSNGAIAAAPMSYPMAYVAQQNGVKLLANMAKRVSPSSMWASQLRAVL
jgi:NitT/TauT family transport system substrate-binding protein